MYIGATASTTHAADVSIAALQYAQVVSLYLVHSSHSHFAVSWLSHIACHHLHCIRHNLLPRNITGAYQSTHLQQEKVEQAWRLVC